MKKAFPIVLLIFGAIFTGYYFLCGSLAGFHVSMLWAWLLLGLLCIGKGLWDLLRKEKSTGKAARVLTVATRSAVSILLAAFVLAEGFVLSGMVKQPKPNLDYIVVLGARVFGTEPSPILQYRIDAAYDYLMENPETTAIVSGGQGKNEDISEAECMARELRKRGISSERILLEDKSTTTAENMAYSRELMTKKDPTVGIVTNNFHVFRSVCIARKRAGLSHISGIPAPYPSVLLPHYMMREFFTITVDTLLGNTI